MALFAAMRAFTQCAVQGVIASLYHSLNDRRQTTSFSISCMLGTFRFLLQMRAS